MTPWRAPCLRFLSFTENGVNIEPLFNYLAKWYGKGCRLLPNSLTELSKQLEPRLEQH